MPIHSEGSDYILTRTNYTIHVSISFESVLDSIGEDPNELYYFCERIAATRFGLYANWPHQTGRRTPESGFIRGAITPHLPTA